MKRAFIFGGGAYDKFFPVICDGDIVIAADAGCEKLREKGIAPNFSIGDFDSSSFVPEDNVIRLPVEKDVTDSCAAADLACEYGADEIYIYGGMGGRPDHTFANYSLLAGLTQKGKRAFLVGEGYEITAVKDGSLTLNGKAGCTVSVFSWSEISQGVSYEGLKYPLDDAVLYKSEALGVSNCLLREKAVISVKNGMLLVMKEIDV